ncbi:MAG TPA: iron ABC transporter permease [Thermoclostridium sp.]|nr:iron ABC transporter permease [Clostridiaceae bacterium]HOQ76060.1 iron ABC transporter permease [Thermoclostridium sp.]HPU45013.1 iron ABC transporter permease [Thermoclostridium sp.]
MPDTGRRQPKGIWSLWVYIPGIILFAAVLFTAVSLGSVPVSLSDTWNILLRYLFGKGDMTGIQSGTETIIAMVRMPRVLLAAMTGGALSLAGAVMQSLLKNPLADGSTLGVSSGGALGAVLSIVLGIRLGFSPELGLALSSIAFSFLSLVFILTLTYRIDRSLSTNTIILTGVIFSMLAGSITSLLIVLSGDSLKQVVFWSMGSFSGKGWNHVILMAPVFVFGSLAIIAFSKELNAFSLGEEQARYIGVDTKTVKIALLVLTSVLIGVSVSVSGTIGFVGLVIPHITRMVTGPDHRKLLPASLITGGIFMVLTDLLSRTLLSPEEFPVGVVTSFTGAVIFIVVFYRYNRLNRRV